MILELTQKSTMLGSFEGGLGLGSMSGSGNGSKKEALTNSKLVPESFQIGSLMDDFSR